MELFAAMFGMSVAMLALAAVGLSLLYPLFWVWMLVDSIVRETWEFPGAQPNDKVVWVLLNALVQPVAVFYYFLVYRKIPRGSVPAPYVQATSAQPPAPATPSAA